MYERSLNVAESILGTRKDLLVPVREVWEHVVNRSKAEGFEVASLVDFSAMLEGDRRFQIIPALGKTQDEYEIPRDGEPENDEMENLGFFSEDRVKLRNVQAAHPELSEDEEEVGSIRRRAFVSQKKEPNINPVRKEAVKIKKQSVGKFRSGKKNNSKSKKSAQRKPAPVKKSVKRKRKK